MTDSPAEEQPSRTDISAELPRLGEAYFVTQHTYDPYNATLLGLDEFDGLSADPSREAGTRAAHELAAIGRQPVGADRAGSARRERLHRHRRADARRPGTALPHPRGDHRGRPGRPRPR